LALIISPVTEFKILYQCSQILNFSQKFDFPQKFGFFKKIWIFHKNYDFSQKYGFCTKISIFNPSFDFWIFAPKRLFFDKDETSIFGKLFSTLRQFT